VISSDSVEIRFIFADNTILSDCNFLSHAKVFCILIQYVKTSR